MKLLLVREEFIRAIKTHQTAFSLNLSDQAIKRLADYYDLVIEHNPLLHLVGPCTPEEFAIRHILESLTLLKHLPAEAKFADVGAGAGLPSVPCLLVRDDLKALLMESKEKKANYLANAVKKLGLSLRTEIVAKQFQEADPADCEFVTCRALDKFNEKIPRLVKWSGRRKILFFGGDNLREALQKMKMKMDEQLMPMSEKRFLFTSNI